MSGTEVSKAIDEITEAIISHLALITQNLPQSYNVSSQ